MVARSKNDLKGKAGGERSHCNELFIRNNDSFPGLQFLLNDIAKKTPFLILVMLFC